MNNAWRCGEGIHFVEQRRKMKISFFYKRGSRAWLTFADDNNKFGYQLKYIHINVPK